MGKTGENLHGLNLGKEFLDTKSIIHTKKMDTFDLLKI